MPGPDRLRRTRRRRPGRARDLPRSPHLAEGQRPLAARPRRLSLDGVRYRQRCDHVRVVAGEGEMRNGLEDSPRVRYSMLSGILIGSAPPTCSRVGAAPTKMARNRRLHLRSRHTSASREWTASCPLFPRHGRRPPNGGIVCFMTQPAVGPTKGRPAAWAVLPTAKPTPVTILLVVTWSRWEFNLNYIEFAEGCRVVIRAVSVAAASSA
jgi:hypothetical protein